MKAPDPLSLHSTFLKDLEASREMFAGQSLAEAMKATALERDLADLAKAIKEQANIRVVAREWEVSSRDALLVEHERSLRSGADCLCGPTARELMSQLNESGLLDQNLVDAAKSLRLDIGLTDFSQAIKEREEFQRVTHARLLDDVSGFASVRSSLALVASDISSRETLFRKPLPDEIGHLLSLTKMGSVRDLVTQHFAARGTFDMAREMSRLTTPWLSLADEVRSMESMAELRSIASAVTMLPSFGAELSTALRADLGDWRSPVSWPSDLGTNRIARTALYVERGFDVALTNFQDDTFAEVLAESDLDSTSIAQLCADGTEEFDLIRTNRCHAVLHRFERRLRKFIHEKMSARYGSNWEKQLDGQLRTDWQARAALDHDSPASAKLIDYADFTDYQRILCNKIFWRDVFDMHFGRKELLTESLQRLYPVRLATMHGRLITREDQLLMHAEVARILRAIK